jgi:hypothetical protein
MAFEFQAALWQVESRNQLRLVQCLRCLTLNRLNFRALSVSAVSLRANPIATKTERDENTDPGRSSPSLSQGFTSCLNAASIDLAVIVFERISRFKLFTLEEPAARDPRSGQEVLSKRRRIKVAYNLRSETNTAI